MSTVPHRKFKQALLPFKTTTISPKKRKLDDEVVTDEAKCRKTRYNDSDSANIKPIDVDHSESNKPIGIERIVTDSDHLRSSQSTIDLDNEARNATPTTIDLTFSDSNQSAIEANDESADSNLCLDFAQFTSESNGASKTKSSTAEDGEITQPNKIESSDNGSKMVALDENDTKIGEMKKLPKPLTPKQLKKKQEAELKRQDRERLKQEKERKRQAELEIKNAEKRQKEEEKKAKEEEKRLKALSKEEERKQKEEEKRQKEEEKRQKDEEKRQKEEEKRQKEEQERRTKEKTAAMFTNFFLKNKPVQTKSNVEKVDELQTRAFMPFEVKADMRLARVCRTILTSEKLQHLDEMLKGDRVLDKNCLYLAQLESKNYKPGHSENTWPLNSNDDGDFQIIETPSGDVIPRYRCKLFQFAENRRPAFWGTWRKRSNKINGRRPFKCDEFYFQYDVDSDDEWVEEEPGESLHGSDDEKESEDEYEVDNDVFVPHGYLSDEEGQNDDVVNSSPKSHNYKLNIMEKEFEAEMNAKTRKLKPRIFGCLWISNDVQKNKGSNEVENLLLNFRAVWNETRTPFRPQPKQTETSSTSTCTIISPLKTPSTKAKKRTDFPESLLPDLIKLVHGSKINAQKLSEEFQTYALSLECGFHLSKVCIQNKIKEISSWWPHKVCWIVSEDVRNRHNLGELSLENQWKYVGTTQANAAAKRITGSNINTNTSKTTNSEPTPTTTTMTTTTTTNELENSTAQQLLTPPKADKTSPKIASITKFMKVLTPEQKAKQFNRLHPDFKIERSSANNSIQSDTKEDVKRTLEQSERPQIKKRAVLFPVERKANDCIDAKCAEKPSNDDNFPLPLSFLPCTTTSKLSSFSSHVEPITSLPECSNTNTKSLSIVEAMAVDDNCCQYSNHFERSTQNAENASGEYFKSDREKQEMTSVVCVSTKKNNAEIRAGKKYAKLITIGKVNGV